MHRSSLVVAVLGAVVMIGCPPAPKPPDPVPPAPQIVAFSASANEVPAGTTVTLQWETRDATSVSVSDATTGPVPGVDAAQTAGSVSVEVDQTTLFILTARNDRGVRESAVLQVSVQEGPARVLFVATPGQIAAGESSVLAWSAPGAKEVAIEDAGGNPLDLGAQFDTGSVKVSPLATTAYRLTVDGDEYEAQVDVSPRISLFAATPDAATLGQPLTLSWRTSGASKLAISLAGTGEIHTEADASKLADGSFDFPLPSRLEGASVLTFTLRVEGASAESATEQKLTVYVEGYPAITEFQVPEYAREGQTFTIAWKTQAAHSVELLRDGLAIYRSPDLATASAGSVELVTPAADEKYQLRAIHGRGGEALSTIENVNPVGAPTVLTFESAPANIANGGDLVTLTWNVPNARNLRVRVKDSILVAERTGPTAETGTVQVYPNADTEWVIEADNGLGEAIEVESSFSAVATPARFVYSPDMAMPVGTPVTLTATTINGSGPVSGLPHSNVLHNAPGEAFIDISETGVDIGTSTDSTTKEITLAEVFKTAIHGMPVATSIISININGWMKLGEADVTGSATETPEPLPSSVLDPLTLTPFWEDLYDDSAAKTYYQLDWAHGAQRLIVQWDRVEYDPIAASELTFQAQIYSSGKVVYAYRAVSDAAASTPVIGVINADGTGAVSSTVRPADGDTLTFFGPVTLPITFPAPPSAITPQIQMGTEGFINIEFAPALLPPEQFVISELSANPPTSVTDGQWIEFENRTATPIDLDGWELDFGGGNVHTLSAANGTTVIPPNGHLVLAQSAGAGDGVAVGYVYGNGFSIPATGGTVGVRLAGGTYARFDAGTTLPGYSMQRGALTQDPILLVETGVTELVCTARRSRTYGSGQHGTPGQPNPPCPVYHFTGGSPSNAFQALATSPTAHRVTLSGGGNESIDAISLPVPVRYGGQPFSTIWVSTNGYISLDAIACTSASDCHFANNISLAPAAVDSGLIAPFWDDLIANSNGGIWWERKVPGLAPDDGYTVVSWEDFKHDTSSFTGSLNFQVRFYDTGDIEFIFGGMSGSTNTFPRGSTATTWLEDPNGRFAYEVNTNSTTAPGIKAMTAYRFVHE